MGFERTEYVLKTALNALEVTKALMDRADIVVRIREGQSTLVYFANEFSSDGAAKAMKDAFGEGEYTPEKAETTKKVYCFSTEKSPEVVEFSLKQALNIR